MKNLKRKKEIKAKSKNDKPNNRSFKKSGLVILVIIGYLFYLFMVLMARLPLIAEQYTNQTMPDTIESHLSFNTDGRQSHYYVELVNQSIPGTIDVYYYTETNSLYVTSQNIKSLTIYCRSMYYDECKDVFGFDPELNSNYYKWFFIEKNHLAVSITSDSDLNMLKFVDAPKPNTVYVNGNEWLEGEKYQYISNQGIALSNITSGSNSVDIYFKPEEDTIKAPVARIIASRELLLVNDVLILDGSTSYDQNPGGNITNYLWDFGDGNFTSGIDIVNHKYTEPGVFGIILTVVNSEYYIDQAYYNITVIDTSELLIYGHVSNVIIPEDSPTWTIDLRKYEPYSDNPSTDYYWHLSGEDTSLYQVSGENSSEDTIFITPNHNQYGNDFVWLWLTDMDGNSIFQPLWINITPVNDPPTIFGIPDITIHYEVPYEFNYYPYIQDVDSPIEKLQINSSEPRFTMVSNMNVTYTYPQYMVGETVYVILTIWDGNAESSDVVAVWITDDWVPNLVTPLPDVYLDEGEVVKNYFDLDDYFMDPDNDTLYYSYGYTHVYVVINPDHSVDFYAPNNWNGEELTTFRATDPSGALVEDIITVVVRPVNDPPVIKNVPDLVVHYDRDYIFDVSPYIYDEDNPIDDLILYTSDPDHIRIDNENHLTIIVNYPYRVDVPYTRTVTLNITDGIDVSFQKITIFVKANYPPALIQPFRELILNEDVPLYNVMNLHDYFKDNDSSMLYFRAINYQMLEVIFHVNGSIDILSAANWSGMEVITFRAQDQEEAFVEGKLRVTVLPVNDPPSILEIPIQYFNVSEKYKLDLISYISDIDNNVTQLEIWIENSEIDCDVFGTNIIFYATKSLTTTVTVHVSDGQDESTQTILLKVTGEKENTQDIYFELLILVLIIILLIVSILGFTYRNYLGKYDVTELYLIYENGILILHVSNEEIDRQETDADIISAMFTAVQDFTRDSFANGKVDGKNWSLKKLEFEGNNILIDRGDYLYITAIFSGRPGKKLGNSLRKIRLEIEKEYGTKLKDWSGEMDQLDGMDKIVNKYKVISKPKINTQLEILEPDTSALEVGTYQTLGSGSGGKDE